MPNNKKFKTFFLKIFTSNRKELREFADCGKRRTLAKDEPKYSECLWDCTWRHNPFYKDNPDTDNFFEDTFNETTIITSFITTPRVPEDLSCLR